ncbi:thioesterase family protein [Ruixingdingia sedimenti]|uniref:Acyl-CoA thioester hydrolase n=1 Tax=Ruixingdingia sedimenti TaxID=3073604 RepID=A0ABU1FDB1_9RHOB|nr:thioesterase family protein [Xinfangfangia sp. LG-4]MDR5654861.1 hypothetical protein [Xinfangfangia sp. LG-4]
MSFDTFGTATLHTRVESWECDFNNHWNARYYTRSFQLAAERVATMGAGANPGMGAITSRLVRYHRELFVSAAAEVRSARIGGGGYAGAIVHLMHSEGRLAATALDLPGTGAEYLPEVTPEEARPALPRGLLRHAAVGWDPEAPDAHTAETGPLRMAEVDHTGRLLQEDITRRSGIALHDLLSRLGYTVEFSARTGVGRMAVEHRATPAGLCPIGTPLRVRSRIASVEHKSFSARHWIETPAGEVVAVVENSLLAVDLKARRAVEVPAFLHRFRR